MNKKVQIEKIRKNRNLRNDFISEYTEFILSSASKALGKFVRKDDDDFSVAILAFDEAITKFDNNKGEFFSFADLMIKNRLIDEYRKRNKNNIILFSELATENDEGDTCEFEVVGNSDVVSDTAVEIEVLKEEMKKYDISFFDLPKYTPKSYKTKAQVYDVLMFIKDSKLAKKSILFNKEIPAKLICESLSIKAKLLERHRKYIIAATIILSGDYPIISEYIHNLKGVAR